MKDIVSGVLILAGIMILGWEFKNFEFLFNIFGGIMVLAGLDLRFGEWK